MKKHACVLGAVAFLGSAALAEDVKSAAAILQTIDRPVPTTLPTATPTENQKLQADVSSLGQVISQLPADEAANRWLALADRQREGLKRIETVPGRYEMPLGFDKIMAILPTAAQLPALKAALDKRPLKDATGQRVAILKMLVATLQNDSPGMDAAFNDLRVAALARGSTPARIDARFADFRSQLAGEKQDDAESVANFERQLAWSMSGELNRESYVPDLVTLAGEAKARELLTRALKGNVVLNMSTGDATKKIARELALAAVPSATVPQWELCQDVNAIDLYEATNKKFPASAATSKPAAKLAGVAATPVAIDENSYVSERNDRERRQAKSFYVVGLIVRGRSDDAFNEAVALSSEDATLPYQLESAIEQLEKQGMSEQVYQFLKRVAVADPKTPFWSMLVSAAAKSGHADEVLQLARDGAAKPDQDAAAQRVSNSHLADALLAADKIDEGIARLQANINAKGDANEQIALHVRLATLGRILGRPALVAGSLDAATAAMLKIDYNDIGSTFQSGWAREMKFAGRSADLTNVFGKQISQIGKRERSYSYETPAPLQQLADAYYTAGAAKDALALFDSFPQWGKADAVELDVGGGMHDSSSPPTFFLAWALIQTGQHEAGMKVLNDLLDKRGGLDAAYVLFLQNDPDPIKKLDTLLAQDPFQERPLIWKAVLQRKAGKLDDAEATLKQAISIDPSDGEEGKGDRMRVYSVMAEVLADKGDAKQAEFFRQVVQSIRLSEDADDAWDAGLLNRAVAAYRTALTHFSDAYCIQSRLAVHLASMGRETEAEEHYRKAYELMPDSFGRVESHCFGCEGAFRSATAQGIAERVFLQLLERNLLKPQLHYLLGYLRVAQDRYAEALPEFRAAVTLDPKYLNAWDKLLDCDSHVALSAKDRDDAIIAILTLDPLGHHVTPSVTKVQDIARLYAAACDAAKTSPPRPVSLYPLRAAADKLAADQQSKDREMFHSYLPDYRTRKSPAALVLENERVRRIVGWVDQFGQ